MYRKKFVKNHDPKLEMSIGPVSNLEDWLNQQKPSTSAYTIRKDDVRNAFIIDVDGDVVLEDFEVTNLPELKGIGIEFGVVAGTITKLYELSLEELYNRIKDFYNTILNNCLGKTIQQQKDYFDSILRPSERPCRINVDVMIANSQNYIRNLPTNPTLQQIKDLAQQVLSGELEYAYYCQHCSVEMNQYAKFIQINLPFYEYLPQLHNLIPKLKTNAGEVEILRQIYLQNDYYYQNNQQKYSEIQLKPITRDIRITKIKYLLICEAPPRSGKYFYKSIDDYLFKQVWKTFFGNNIPGNPANAYQALADLGFLLVDSLPYSLNYRCKRRRTSYHDLIKACLLWWQAKLNHFSFDSDLKIAFGFTINARNIIKATRGELTLGSKDFFLTEDMIAATTAGQPSTGELSRVFNIISR